MAKTIYDFDPRNLPTGIKAALGFVLASSAHTEQMIEAAIAGCLGLDVEYGAAVTTHMAFPLRMSALRSAAEIRLSVLQLDELDDILKEIGAAIDLRNATVQGKWCFEPSPGSVYNIKRSARISVQTGVVPQTVEKIESEALAIYEAGIRLWPFLLDNELAPPVPPHRPRGHKSQAA